MQGRKTTFDKRDRLMDLDRPIYRITTCEIAIGSLAPTVPQMCLTAVSPAPMISDEGSRREATRDRLVRLPVVDHPIATFGLAYAKPRNGRFVSIGPEAHWERIQ